MSDLLITDEAVEAAADVLGRHWAWGTEHRSSNEDTARAALEAALPLLERQHLELTGSLGYGLGRRDAAEEIAADLRRLAALHPGDGWQAITASALVEAARIAREFATRPPEPSTSPDDPQVPPRSENALTGQPEASEPASRSWPENGRPHPPGRCGDPNCGGDW